MNTGSRQFARSRNRGIGAAVLFVTTAFAQPAPPEFHKLEVGAAAALHGQLVGPAREQAAMVLLWPQEPSADGPAAVYVLPDANGAFTVDDLPPGRYRLQWAAGKSWQAGPWKPEAKNGTELELPAGGTTRVELP